MIETQSCLFIIDSVYPDSQFIEYFSKFGFQIIQKPTISDFADLCEKPTALLINYDVVKETPSLIAKLYQKFIVPLIVISDKDDEEICVQMLAHGADDFLIKPLHPRELHARINAISRRVSLSLKNRDNEKEVLSFADWYLYPSSRQVFNARTKEELSLSTGEYALLFAFLRQPHQVLDREFLLQVTKNVDLCPFDRRIDVQISRLRQKIEKDAKKPLLIKTIRNGGYLFTAKVITSKESK